MSTLKSRRRDGRVVGFSCAKTATYFPTFSNKAPLIPLRRLSDSERGEQQEAG